MGATAIDGASEHRPITTLDSGVRVVTERVPSVRSVALGFWITTGSATERDDQAGISHLLEHMLFRGTERFGSEEIDQIFDGMGAEINAGTDKESTSLYTRVLDGHLERAFDVIERHDLVPSLRRARGRAGGRARGDRDVRRRSPGAASSTCSARPSSAHTRSGAPSSARAEVVGASTREQLARFHAERYTAAAPS